VVEIGSPWQLLQQRGAESHLASLVRHTSPAAWEHLLKLAADAHRRRGTRMERRGSIV
jgi:hypothetical protein